MFIHKRNFWNNFFFGNKISFNVSGITVALNLSFNSVETYLVGRWRSRLAADGPPPGSTKAVLGDIFSLRPGRPHCLPIGLAQGLPCVAPRSQARQARQTQPIAAGRFPQGRRLRPRGGKLCRAAVRGASPRIYGEPERSLGIGPTPLAQPRSPFALRVATDVPPAPPGRCVVIGAPCGRRRCAVWGHVEGRRAVLVRPGRLCGEVGLRLPRVVRVGFGRPAPCRQRGG